VGWLRHFLWLKLHRLESVPISCPKADEEANLFQSAIYHAVDCIGIFERADIVNFKIVDKPAADGVLLWVAEQ